MSLSMETYGDKPSAFSSKRRSIVELDHNDARAFFLKHESYCRIDLPHYLQFDGLIGDVYKVLKGKNLKHYGSNPRAFYDINHVILDNKDGKYEWRPLELIHPALYVSLVDSITEPEHWSLIKEKFQEFSYNPSIKCLSIPVTPLDEEKDIAAQISHWWETIELHSIELSLDYEVTIHTDIVNCHGSIYTHTIAWALHTKTVAKGHRDPYESIGNIIDNYIQNMRQGQTNGIPQGSVLMDFVVEMVLGYADTELAKRDRRLTGLAGPDYDC